MLDSCSSYNLMPLLVMEQLSLEIIRPYKDLYYFDSKRVRFLGMIKYLVVNLTQIPMKSVVMEVVVVHIPARFGMIFSRSWGSNIGGSIKLDPTYDTIPIFAGEERRLHRESRFIKTVTRVDFPNNALV